MKLVKLGCGGETTTSFLTGQGNSGDALLLGCNPAGGSQMVAAERFLREHRRRGEVALLTLDIGANDIDGCEAEEAIDATCVIRGAEHISANLPVIMRRLRRAAAPGTPMAAMTLYDPFLQLYLTPGGHAEAIASDEYARNVNEGLARLYRAGGFRVAHVDVAFHTYDLSRKTSLAGQPHPVPVAVAEVCRLTWMCAPRSRGTQHPRQQGGLRSHRASVRDGVRVGLSGCVSAGTALRSLAQQQARRLLTRRRQFRICSRARAYADAGRVPELL